MANLEAIHSRFDRLSDKISSLDEHISKRLDEVIAFLNRKSDPVQQQSDIPFAQPDTLRVQPNSPILPINSPIRSTPSFRNTSQLNKPAIEETQDSAEKKELDSVKNEIESANEPVLTMDNADPRAAKLALMGSDDTTSPSLFVATERLLCSYDLRIRIKGGIHTPNISSLSKSNISSMVLRYGHRGHARNVFEEMSDMASCSSFKLCAGTLISDRVGIGDNVDCGHSSASVDSKAANYVSSYHMQWFDIDPGPLGLYDFVKICKSISVSEATVYNVVVYNSVSGSEGKEKVHDLLLSYSVVATLPEHWMQNVVFEMPDLILQGEVMAGYNLGSTSKAEVTFFPYFRNYSCQLLELWWRTEASIIIDGSISVEHLSGNQLWKIALYSHTSRHKQAIILIIQCCLAIPGSFFTSAYVCQARHFSMEHLCTFWIARGSILSEDIMQLSFVMVWLVPFSICFRDGVHGCSLRVCRGSISGLFFNYQMTKYFIRVRMEVHNQQGIGWKLRDTSTGFQGNIMNVWRRYEFASLCVSELFAKVKYLVNIIWVLVNLHRILSDIVLTLDWGVLQVVLRVPCTAHFQKFKCLVLVQMKYRGDYRIANQSGVFRNAMQGEGIKWLMSFTLFSYEKEVFPCSSWLRMNKPMGIWSFDPGNRLMGRGSVSSLDIPGVHCDINTEVIRVSDGLRVIKSLSLSSFGIVFDPGKHVQKKAAGILIKSYRLANKVIQKDWFIVIQGWVTCSLLFQKIIAELQVRVRVLHHKYGQDYCVRVDDNVISPIFHRGIISGAVQMFRGRAVEHMCIKNWELSGSFDQWKLCQQNNNLLHLLMSALQLVKTVLCLFLRPPLDSHASRYDAVPRGSAGFNNTRWKENQVREDMVYVVTVSWCNLNTLTIGNNLHSACPCPLTPNMETLQEVLSFASTIIQKNLCTVDQWFLMYSLLLQNAITAMLESIPCTYQRQKQSQLVILAKLGHLCHNRINNLPQTECYQGLTPFTTLNSLAEPESRMNTHPFLDIGSLLPSPYAFSVSILVVDEKGKLITMEKASDTLSELVEGAILDSSHCISTSTSRRKKQNFLHSDVSVLKDNILGRGFNAGDSTVGSHLLWKIASFDIQGSTHLQQGYPLHFSELLCNWAMDGH